jgi:hypothetical protein
MPGNVGTRHALLIENAEHIGGDSRDGITRLRTVAPPGPAVIDDDHPEVLLQSLYDGAPEAAIATKAGNQH